MSHYCCKRCGHRYNECVCKPNLVTDLDISKALALAIGWAEQQISEHKGVCYVNVSKVNDSRKEWKVFDYKDCNLLVPIQKKYFVGVSPYVNSQGKVTAWEANQYSEKTGLNRSLVQEDTLEAAVAMTVIHAHRAGLLK